MLKRLLVTVIALTFVITMGYADQSTKKVVIPVDKTSAIDGRQMFTNYCAPCHGADGRGNGPAASALRSQPVNLTELTKAHHGKYPDTHVVSVLEFGAQGRAHDSAQMPVWGPILANMNHANSQERALRIANLSRYLENIQVK